VSWLAALIMPPFLYGRRWGGDGDGQGRGQDRAWHLALLQAPGIAGCLTTIGIVTCLVSATKKSQDDAIPATEQPLIRRARRLLSASAVPADRVLYSRGCNVRAAPKSGAAKVGFAAANRLYTVEERQGQWRKIRLEDGTEGWAACAVAGGREASKEEGLSEDEKAELRRLIRQKLHGSRDNEPSVAE